MYKNWKIWKNEFLDFHFVRFRIMKILPQKFIFKMFLEGTEKEKKNYLKFSMHQRKFVYEKFQSK